MTAARGADLNTTIALTRLSVGARPGEISAVLGDPRTYLKAQIRTEGADIPTDISGGSLKSTVEIFADDLRGKEIKANGGIAGADQYREMLRNSFQTELLARVRLGTQTGAGFRERWALFWCNHFACTQRGHSQAVVGAFQREALRPRVFGRFADLLLASTRHPTMLLFLDQPRSVGPDSLFGQRHAKLGLNENLAREVMELHTLGVDAGYSQNDVTEMARALTGWSINKDGRFEYHPTAHEPGARQIFGKRYEQGGEDQATAALLDFAASPHTAHHLATKIAQHFVADDPPPSLVAKLEGAYRDSSGQLDRVAATLIDAPETWDPPARKFKTPYEFVVSSWRATGTAPTEFPTVIQPLRALGQEVFDPPSPKGWDDTAADWAGAAAVMERVRWSNVFATKFGATVSPAERARDVLGARLTPASATAIARAETRNEAFALLLMTPEFQRR